MANPELDEAERADLVGRLMEARRAVRDAKTERRPQGGSRCAQGRGRGQTGARRAGPGLVGRRLAGSQPAHGEEHDLCRLVREDRALPTPEDSELPKAAIFDVDGTLLDFGRSSCARLARSDGEVRSRRQLRAGARSDRQGRRQAHSRLPVRPTNSGTTARKWRNGAASASRRSICRWCAPSRRSRTCCGACGDAGLRIAVASSAKKDELDKYLDIARHRRPGRRDDVFGRRRGIQAGARHLRSRF